MNQNRRYEFIEDRRIIISVVIAIFSIYLAILWGFIANETYRLPKDDWDKIVESRKKLEFLPDPAWCRKCYFFSSFVTIPFLALTFGMFAGFLAPSRYLDDFYSIDNCKWKFYVINVLMLLYVFMFPALFLNTLHIVICFVVWLSSFFTLSLLAGGVIEFLFSRLLRRP